MIVTVIEVEKQGGKLEKRGSDRGLSEKKREEENEGFGISLTVPCDGLRVLSCRSTHSIVLLGSVYFAAKLETRRFIGLGL